MPKTELTDEQRTELNNVRILADSMGIDVHPRMKIETIKNLINLKEQQNLHEQQLVANREKEKQDVVKLDKRADADRMKTEDEIVGFIQRYINKGVTIQFNGDDTWTMRYNKKEDSGHMTVSQTAVVTAAERIISGRQPTGYQNDDGKLVLSA